MKQILSHSCKYLNFMIYFQKGGLAVFTYDFKNFPSVSMTGRTSERSEWSHNGRAMDTNLLVLFHTGACNFLINGKKYYYKKGDVAIVPKWTYYAPHTNGGCEYTFFHFDGDFTKTDTFVPSVLLNNQLSFYGHIQPASRILAFDYKIMLEEKEKQVSLLLDQCISLDFLYDTSAQLLLSLRLTEILLHVSEAYLHSNHNETKCPATLNKIITYIRSHYRENISLEDISENILISKQYIMRLFRQYLHTSVNAYLTELKMKHAVYLLKHTNMNVSDTAEYLGYTSVSYFSQAFKHYYGVSPSSYLYPDTPQKP